MRFLHDHHHQARAGACLLGLLTVSLLAGCGGGGGGNGNSGGGSNTNTAGTNTAGTSTAGTNTAGTNSAGINSGGQSLTVTANTANNLTASITEASSTVSVGGTLVYTLTLTNNTASAIPVHAFSFPVTTPAVVLTITGPTGNVSFAPVPYPATVYNGSLAPGQTISLTQTANGFTTAGTYSAVATFGDDVAGPKSVGPLLVTAQ